MQMDAAMRPIRPTPLFEDIEGFFSVWEASRKRLQGVCWMEAEFRILDRGNRCSRQYTIVSIIPNLTINGLPARPLFFEEWCTVNSMVLGTVI